MLKKSLLPGVLLAGLALVFTSSCDNSRNARGVEYMPDMYRGPALEAYQPYGRFKDSTSARLPVEGTVPRGFMTYTNYSPLAEGYNQAKAELKMPEPILTDTMALLEGKELYGIFCTQCHGDKGDGQGILVKNEKFLGVPSYADRDINHGSIFHVVTYGKGVMGAHASQVTPEERWKLALYVMKLRKDLVPDEVATTEVEEEDQADENQG
jgi:mono/diheme cytochrome c family protein